MLVSISNLPPNNFFFWISFLETEGRAICTQWRHLSHHITQLGLFLNTMTSHITHYRTQSHLITVFWHIPEYINIDFTFTNISTHFQSINNFSLTFKYIYLFIHLFIFLFTYLIIYLFIYLFLVSIKNLPPNNSYVLRISCLDFVTSLLFYLFGIPEF